MLQTVWLLRCSESVCLLCCAVAAGKLNVPDTIVVLSTALGQAMLGAPSSAPSGAPNGAQNGVFTAGVPGVPVGGQAGLGAANSVSGGTQPDLRGQHGLAGNGSNGQVNSGMPVGNGGIPVGVGGIPVGVGGIPVGVGGMPVGVGGIPVGVGGILVGVGGMPVGVGGMPVGVGGMPVGVRGRPMQPMQQHQSPPQLPPQPAPCNHEQVIHPLSHFHHATASHTTCYNVQTTSTYNSLRCTDRN